MTVLIPKLPLAVISAAFLVSGHVALAQNAVQPSSDWNGNWGFSSSSDRTQRLLQADVIKKEEVGYYESLGHNTFNVTNDITNVYDHRQGSFDSITAGDGSEIDVSTRVGDDIGQQTTTVGTMQNSQTTLTIDGDGNVMTATNSAESEGCQDGRISVLSAGPGGAQFDIGSLC